MADIAAVNAAIAKRTVMSEGVGIDCWQLIGERATLGAVSDPRTDRLNVWEVRVFFGGRK